MLRALYLGNFKAFAATARLPIRPVTLIFGPNSAGKSSLIHGLALGYESIVRDCLDIGRTTTLRGGSIDLGGFRQYVHRRALDERVTWGVEMELPEVTYRPLVSLGTRHVSLHSTYGLSSGPATAMPPSVVTHRIEAGGELILRLRRRPDARLEMVEMTPAFLRYAQIFSDARRAGRTGASEDDGAWDPAELTSAASALSFGSRGLFPAPFGGSSSGGAVVQPGSPEHTLLGLVAPLLSTSREALAAELQGFTYLGPLRSYPPRHLAFTERDDAGWMAGGGDAWDRLRRDDGLRDKVNLWLGSAERLQTPYKVSLRKFVAPETARNAILNALADISARLGLEPDPEADSDEEPDPVPMPDEDPGVVMNSDPEQAPVTDWREKWDAEAFAAVVAQNILLSPDVEGDADLVLVDMRTGTTVSHRDVGIGISQVLPVLVEAYGNENRLVAIEQPEIHLHPRLQAELADVFLESALGTLKNTFILETHSEHLILRVMRRIRETAECRLPEGMPPVRPEDVAVLYVVPDASGARIVEIPITEDGEFGGPWPGGFFAERMKELY